eukprot:2016089-Pyramimonas_sp.AAC.1
MARHRHRAIEPWSHLVLCMGRADRRWALIGSDWLWLALVGSDWLVERASAGLAARCQVARSLATEDNLLSSIWRTNLLTIQKFQHF